MDYKEWLRKAKEHIETIPEGQMFCARDLFQGTVWNSLTKGEKLSFGKCFKNAVMDKHFPSIEYIGKADNNSAQYIKKERENK